MKAVFATGPKGEFGTATGLPWEHSKEDMARFSAMTKDKELIVGKTTFEMLPELKGRVFTVVTDNHTLWGKRISARNSGFCAPLESALMSNGLLIGGAKLLKAAWPSVHQFMWSYMYHVGQQEEITTHFRPDLNSFTEIYSEKRTDHLFSIYRRV